MLENVRKQITRLIAAYESEREQKLKLQSELDEAKAENEAYRKQIIELERQIDNQKLTDAFMAGGTDTAAAKKKIDSLVREIDRCIKLMEG
ncbi:MAG: hypothetical protein E7112_05200 [Bacteroidales bacterium]|nr:hypothetical protein [Bacteroidales bacterium]